MWWHRRWESHTIPGTLGEALGPHRWRAWGQTAEMVPAWLSWVPGVVTGDLLWSQQPAEPGPLLALLALYGLEELDLRSGVDSHVRWSADGRLQVRAPRESRWWTAWQARFQNPSRCRARIDWVQGHRRHNAWLTDGVAGLELTDGRGYREWTLAGPALAAALLPEWLPTFPVRRLLARVRRPRLLAWDYPGEPARVLRWDVSWAGASLPRETPPALQPSWHYRWQHHLSGLGAVAVADRTATLGQPGASRLALACRSTAAGRGFGAALGRVRQAAQRMPPGVDWWSGEASATDYGAVFLAWSRRAAAYTEAARQPGPELAGSTSGPYAPWWRRWPSGESGVWWASHPRWPEQAIVVRHPERGPYAGRVEVRWGWQGPRWAWPAHEGPVTLLRRLRGSRESLERWWESLAAAERAAVSDVRAALPEPSDQTVRSRESTESTSRGQPPPGRP